MLRSFPKQNRPTHTSQNKTVGFDLTKQSVFVTCVALNLTNVLRVRSLKTSLSPSERNFQDRNNCTLIVCGRATAQVPLASNTQVANAK